MNIIRKPPEIAVKELLASALLPTADLTPAHMEHFFGAWAGSTLEGVVGLELYGNVALLRSLAVTGSRRGAGVGASLMAQAEHYAVEKGIGSLYLLTSTAQSYFMRRGYSVAERGTAPAEIRNTQEYASLCPSSAVLMVKHCQGST